MADCRNLSGDRIRIARSLHRPKMTQEDLIAKLQVEHQIYFSRNTISRIETGVYNRLRTVGDIQGPESAHSLAVEGNR